MNTARPSAPAAVSWITRTLEEAGHDTWAVGGAVRDALMGRRSGDWDLTTQARPDQLQKLFQRTVPIGIEHGTVGVLARDGTMFEVTTFRKDVETDGRHAVVAFADRVEDDLARRDFTINAIAWHPLREELLDPFRGIEDLEAGVLRTVGIAADRLAEDYLRVLRAIRFAGRFALKIEEETWSALCECVRHLPSLSAERIRDELVKVLSADRKPSGALTLYAESGALSVLYPELSELRASIVGDDPWSEKLASVDQLPPGRPYLRLAQLLWGLDPSAVARVLTRLRLSTAQVDEVARRAECAEMPSAEADDEAFRRWLSATGPTRLAAVARLSLARARARHLAGHDDTCDAVVAAWRRARAVLATGPALSVAELEFDGRDLIRMGLRPGPGFGLILDDLLDFVLEDPARNRTEVLESRVGDIAGSGDG
ncbi:MAG: CCA tRNA nucleotidyltransferase [Gemmatimonadetes bacterium]|nr:CCA tRNA nucleotidyltransferase [Gemmatimonadota bacterium]